MIAGVPQTVGRFRLLDEIGAGSFATVWRALDSELNRDVALKLPRQQLDERSMERFLREARRVARVNHPGIVRVYEAGIDEQTRIPYIVLELIEGVTLREWISFTHPNAKECARILEAIAKALHHAHEEGIIHRDLKPSNILVDLSGGIHVTDFGLAHAVGIDATQASSTTGTIAYMSPEQAGLTSNPVSRPSDVYSLGVMLFEMLTGSNPISASSPAEHLVKLNTGIRNDLSRLAKETPIELRQICDKCLEHEPRDRFLTANELADELRRFRDGEPLRFQPPSYWRKSYRWCKKRRLILSLILAAFGLLAASIWLFVQSRHDQKQRVENTITAFYGCPAESLSDVFSQLELNKEAFIERLLLEADGSDPTRSLRSLIALVRFGYPRTESLLDRITSMNPNEARNVIETLSVNPQISISAIKRHFAANRDNLEKSIRIALIGAHVGTLEPVSEIVNSISHTEVRYKLISTWVSFHGDPYDWFTWSEREASGDTKYVIALTVGEYSKTVQDLDWCIASLASLKLLGESVDARVRNAAQWSATQVTKAIQRLDPTKAQALTSHQESGGEAHNVGKLPWEPREFSSIELGEGMTLVALRVPKTPNADDKHLIWVADAEISFRQFAKYDNEGTAMLLRSIQEKYPHSSFDADNALGSVTPIQAFSFCNWLSDRYGLARCYEINSSSVEPELLGTKLDAGGFRLPLVEEWNHLMKSQSGGSFYFGDDENELSRYGHISAKDGFTTWRKRYPPNGFGLFDMIGCVAEACHIEGKSDKVRYMGGSLMPVPGEFIGVYVNVRSLTTRSIHLGFRVVCDALTPTAGEKK